MIFFHLNVEGSKEESIRKSVDLYTLTTHAMQLATLYVQISKNQTCLLYTVVTNVDVCATDTAWLMGCRLCNSN